MAVVGMMGVSFVGPGEEVERIALSLLGAGNFEPMPPEVMMSGHPLGSRIQSFKENRYDALLEKLDRLWTEAGFMVPQRPAVTNVSETPLPELSAKVEELMRMKDKWRAAGEALRKEYEAWRAILEFGNVLREIGRGFGDLPRSPYTGIAIGILTRENWRRLSETSLAAPIMAMPLSEDSVEKTVTAVIFYNNDYKEDLQKILSSVHMRPITLNPEKYGMYDNPDAVRYRMEAIESAMLNRKATAAHYISENRFELGKLYASVYAMQRVYSLCRLRGEISGMMVLSGWTPRENYSSVSAMAEREAPNTVIIAEQGSVLEKEGNKLPTLLRNWPLVRRFQEIVRLYSLPAYSERDPTFVLAVSFCLFFGFMFGDVGHGLGLLAGTCFLEKKKIMGPGIASVMKIAGTFSVLFGFLYGSVFGNEELISPLWLSPMHSVNTMLPVSIGIGVAFLTIGMCFRLWNVIREGEWGEALFSPEGLAGLLFYWLALAQVASKAAGESILGNGVFAVIMLSLFLVMVFGNGISKYFFNGKMIDEGGITHAFSIFHAMMSFVSNTASFVRLAAFALNHAGLSMTIIVLGDVIENVPGGRLFSALVLLLGHLLIVGLEGLIVFIQTLRLEYYEFFGKFYHGGGREFAPVLWDRRNSAS
ncbi:MAG: ATPase [Synergistaceae bacterium]|nr:ATPase [Synergistaceae bacterium]